MPALPDTSGYVPPDRDRHPDYIPTPPANPALPKQERGLRPARPLPYDLVADGRVGADGLAIDFADHGAAAATFHVTSTTHANGPWTYTVGAGRRLSATWSGKGAYDVRVHGPNGFFRRLAGHGGGAGPEVAASDDGAREEVRLVLTNGGKDPVRLTVKDAYGNGRTATYRVQPGGRAVHVASAGRSHGWYDLSVVSDHDDTFLRRLAGHVETGRPSTSDPAIITS
ncbi:phospholipase domain-containing protein [Actinoallomurus acanthiterrae]